MGAGNLGHDTEHLLFLADLNPLKKLPFNSSEHRICKGEEFVPQLVLHALIETDEELLEATVGGGGADCRGAPPVGRLNKQSQPTHAGDKVAPSPLGQDKPGSY